MAAPANGRLADRAPEHRSTAGGFPHRIPSGRGGVSTVLLHFRGRRTER